MKCITCENEITWSEKVLHLSFICEDCLCWLDEKFTKEDIVSDTKISISHKAKQRNVVFK